MPRWTSFEVNTFLLCFNILAYTELEEQVNCGLVSLVFKLIQEAIPLVDSSQLTASKDGDNKALNMDLIQDLKAGRP